MLQGVSYAAIGETIIVLRSLPNLIFNTRASNKFHAAVSTPQQTRTTVVGHLEAAFCLHFPEVFHNPQPVHGAALKGHHHHLLDGGDGGDDRDGGDGGDDGRDYY